MNSRASLLANLTWGALQVWVRIFALLRLLKLAGRFFGWHFAGVDCAENLRCPTSLELSQVAKKAGETLEGMK
jgi:hypothetical protein